MIKAFIKTALLILVLIGIFYIGIGVQNEKNRITGNVVLEQGARRLAGIQTTIDESTSTSSTTSTTLQMAKYAIIDTNYGDIEILILENFAPKTSAHFENLVRAGEYNGDIFHRVVSGFIIQTGDPTGTGYNHHGGLIEDEFNTGLHFNGPGVVAMANSGPGTSGSQFFITMKAEPHLDGSNSIFGWVRGGMDTVNRINGAATGKDYRPLKNIYVQDIRIKEKEAEFVFS